MTPVTDAEDLRLDGAVVWGMTPDGQAAVGGLSLVMDARGLTVIVPGGGPPRTAPWTRISAPRWRSPANLPDGSPATALALDAGGLALEFLLPLNSVPAELASTLESRVVAFVTRYGNAASSQPTTTALEDPPLSKVPPPPTPPSAAPSPPPAPPSAALAPRPAPVEAPPPPPLPLGKVPPPPTPPLSKVPAPPAPPPSKVPSPPAPPPAAPALTARHSARQDRAARSEGETGPGPTATAAGASAPERAIDDGPAASAGHAETTDKVGTAPSGKRPGETRETRTKRSKEATGKHPGETRTKQSKEATGKHSKKRGDDLEVVPAPTRRRRRLIALVVVLLVVLLAAGAAGAWYYKRHHASGPAIVTPAQAAADTRLASGIGVRADYLSGFTVTSGSRGNVFAAGAVVSSAATAAAARAAATLANCLHVPAPDVRRAFDTAPATLLVRTASVGSPVFVDPSGDTASSVVDVMRLATTEEHDFQVFADASLFAACYTPYAQTMAPFSASVPTSGSSTAAPSTAVPSTAVTVQPATVPAPASPGVHVRAYTVTRTTTVGGQAIPVVTTAVAVFGGRLQATLAVTGPSGASGFPSSTENAVVQAVEANVALHLAS